MRMQRGYTDSITQGVVDVGGRFTRLLRDHTSLG